MVYVTGDMHGDYALFSQKKFKNIKEGDTLIVCGDFGFIWRGDSKEKKILDKLGKKKYKILFVDGTHENFDLIARYPVVNFAGGKAHKIRDNIYHLMRGQIFEIEGEKYFAMGGGESPDIERCKYKVDYMITHEPSQKIKNFLRLKDNEPLTVSGLNAYLQELSANCDFKCWFFGSLHEDKFVSATQVALFQNLVNAQTGEVVS